MPTYKMTYFNLRGRGEIVRLAFAQAGVEYEDTRIEFPEWPQLKKEVPFGTLPFIEVDGKRIGQSMACARYVAKQGGLMGKDAFEEAQVNAVCDSFTDMLEILVKAKSAKTDEDKKETLDKLPNLVTSLETYLKENDGGNGFFVGKDVTLADIRAYDCFTSALSGKPELREISPLLSALRDRVEALPRIKAWLEKRPETAY